MFSDLSDKTVAPDSSSELRKQAGAWLRARRCELGLSQRELAVRVKMEPTLLCLKSKLAEVNASRPLARLGDSA